MKSKKKDEVSDANNPSYLFSLTSNHLLKLIVKGKIDPVLLAKEELAARGLNSKGKWVGFDKARKCLGFQ